MRAAVEVLWESLRDWYNGMVGLATMNVVWLALSLTVILLPPATAGLWVVTNSLARGTGAHYSDLWQGMWRYAWASYRWALINAAAGVIFAVCFRFYGSAGGMVGAAIQVLCVAGGVLWLAMQFYLWPFLIVQQEPAVRLALKNALFLTLATPLYTCVLVGAVALVVVISLATILPLGVFLTSFVALLGNRAVIERLSAYGKLPGLIKTGETR